MDYNLVIKFVAALPYSFVVLPLIIFEHYYAATRLSLIGRIIILYLGIEFPFIYPSWKSKFWVIVRSRWIASYGVM